MSLSQVVDSLWKSSRRTLVALALAASYAVPVLPSTSCDYTAQNNNNNNTPSLGNIESQECAEGGSVTTESGVRIIWRIEPDKFPYAMNVTPLCWQTDINQTVAAVIRGLAKYPDLVLTSNLEAVYLFESIEIHNTPAGGTVDPSAQRVYIARTNLLCRMERVFHAEFSSVLISWHPWDISRWASENPKDFTYGNDAIAAIQEGRASGELNLQLAEDGFLTEYSLTSAENDFNAYVKYHFLPEPLLWEIVDTYERVRQKSLLMVNFYRTLHSQYTNAFFRGLEPCDE